MTSVLVRRLSATMAAAALALVAAAALPGATAQAAPASPTVAVVQQADLASAPSLGLAPMAAKAGYWELVGVFPDPITCTIAGATTGRNFYCGFYFFFWGLNVWNP
jgi:hypothetical protein